jgi:hypothetical protein
MYPQTIQCARSFYHNDENNSASTNCFFFYILRVICKLYLVNKGQGTIINQNSRNNKYPLFGNAKNKANKLM